MAARQPSASFADRDASLSHRSMMTERDERPYGSRLAQVWNVNEALPQPVKLSASAAVMRATGNTSR